MKVVGTGTGMVSPNRAPGTVSLSPARVPDVDPIDAAAHLQLLGESLSLIGHRLQETEVDFHMDTPTYPDCKPIFRAFFKSLHKTKLKIKSLCITFPVGSVTWKCFITMQWNK